MGIDSYVASSRNDLDFVVCRGRSATPSRTSALGGITESMRKQINAEARLSVSSQPLRWSGALRHEARKSAPADRLDRTTTM
jgi:hypothetical protein